MPGLQRKNRAALCELLMSCVHQGAYLGHQRRGHRSNQHHGGSAVTLNPREALGLKYGVMVLVIALNRGPVMGGGVVSCLVLLGLGRHAG